VKYKNSIFPVGLQVFYESTALFTESLLPFHEEKRPEKQID